MVDTAGDLSQRPARWGLLCVELRADATNSSIWAREKLHFLDDVAIVADESAVRAVDAEKAFARKRCLSDLQVVCGSDAESCTRMFETAEIPTWEDLRAGRSGQSAVVLECCFVS